MRRAARAAVAALVVVDACATSAARAESIEIRPRVGYANAGSASPVQLRSGGGFLGTSAGVTFDPRVPPPLTPGGGFWDGGIGGGLQVGALLAGGTIAIGLDVGARRVFPSKTDFYQDASRWDWSVGPYVRAYAPIAGWVRAWWASGVSYVADRQSYSYDGRLMVTATHHGLAVPFSLGVDVQLTTTIMLAPSIEIARVVPLSACVDGPVATSTDPNAPTMRSACTSDTNAVVANAYTTWTLALGTRVAL